MSTSTARTAHDADGARLRTALIIAPVAWALNGLLGWFVATQACLDGTDSWGALSGGGVRVLLGLVSIGALGATLFGLMTAATIWRRNTAGPGLDNVQGGTSVSFLAAAGLLMGIIFTFGVVLNALAPIMVGVCESTR
jgi:hypothetical protein